uniref:NF-kappa-B inhibitor-interacting Ras-like protein n=1 Tax=Parascaris univalens TaxID=6257 RepID=A0A915AFF2_PARUN
ADLASTCAERLRDRFVRLLEQYCISSSIEQVYSETASSSASYSRNRTAAGVLALRRSSLAHFVFGNTNGNGNPLLSTTSSAAIPAAYNSNGSVAYSPNARKHDRHRSLIFDSGQLIPDRPAIKSDEEGRQESVYPAAVRQLEHLNLERKSSVPAQVLSALTGSSTAAAHARAMGRVMRVVVAGCKKVGKTACLQQLACVNDITSQMTLIKCKWIMVIVQKK